MIFIQKNIIILQKNQEGNNITIEVDQRVRKEEIIKARVEFERKFPVYLLNKVRH